MLNFHEMFMDKYDRNISQNEKELKLVEEQINHLYTLDGKSLLTAWLLPPVVAQPPKSRRSRHFLSVPPSRHSSIVGTPISSPKKTRNYESDFLNSRSDIVRYDTPHREKEKNHKPLNYFAIGMFLKKARAA